MSTIKTLAVAAALLAGASSLAMAQGTMNQGTGSPSNNAQMSGGSGSHRDTPRTGAGDTQQKIQKNQNGYSTKQ
jgi:Spy/CpxP family protein refolding chaperone